MFIITLLLQYVCYFTMIQSALGFSFFFSFFSLERMELADDKNASFFFGKCTGAQMYFCYWNLVKKKIYRT